MPGAKPLPETNHRRLPASLLQKMAFQYATQLREESLSLGESGIDDSDASSEETSSSDTGSDSSDECVHLRSKQRPRYHS